MLVRTCLVVILLLVSRPSTARAGGVFGVELTGTLSAYHMGDFNDSLRTFNAEIGTAFGEITGGGAWGANIRLWPNQKVLFRLGVQNWSAVTESQGYTFDASTWSLQGGAAYFLDTHLPFRVGLGAGLDILTPHGGLEGPGVDLKGSGSGIGAHGTVEAMVPMGRQWSGIVTLGYRFAGTDEVKLDEAPTSLAFDYTGPYLQFGLAFDGR
jgi:hypothetical protein